MKRILEHFLGWENSISKKLFFLLCFDTRKKCRKLILWKKKRIFGKTFHDKLCKQFSIDKKKPKKLYLQKKSPENVFHEENIFFSHAFTD